MINYNSDYGIGDQGINLGFVSVSPLVAVQVAKNDYGEKVVKPFVHLHITPNEGLVHKFSHALAHKKQTIFGGHYDYAPHYFARPLNYYEKPIHPYPSNTPNQNLLLHHKKSYHQSHQQPHQHISHYINYPIYTSKEELVSDDYDYSGYGDYDDFYKSTRTNESFVNLSSKHLQNNVAIQKTLNNDLLKKRVNFPERRKRDIHEVSL